MPAAVTPGASPATSALTITTTSATPIATSSVTVTGTAGALTHSTSVGLTVHRAGDAFMQQHYPGRHFCTYLCLCASNDRKRSFRTDG